MHDTPDHLHWQPNPRLARTPRLRRQVRRAPMPYDRFMEAEGVPIYRGIGVRRVQDLPLVPWTRLGGRGSYIQLYGTEGLWGCYVVEVAAAGALNVERHLYEKVVLVVEGRGTTEVWQGRPRPSGMCSNGRPGPCLLLPLERVLPSDRERRQFPGLAAVRDHRTERHEPVR